MNTNKPVVKLLGNDGNAFVILGACLKAARHAGFSKEQIATMQRKMMSGDYHNLLNVAAQYFNIQ